MDLRKIFHNGRELRPGWRLLIFCILVFVIGYVLRNLVERLHLADYPGLHPVNLIVGDAALLAIALAATAIMGHFERRSFAVYGIPIIRELFGRLFWKGVVWGVVMPSAIIFLIYLGGGYRVHGLNVTGPSCSNSQLYGSLRTCSSGLAKRLASAATSCTRWLMALDSGRPQSSRQLGLAPCTTTQSRMNDGKTGSP